MWGDVVVRADDALVLSIRVRSIEGIEIVASVCVWNKALVDVVGGNRVPLGWRNIDCSVRKAIMPRSSCGAIANVKRYGIRAKTADAIRHSRRIIQVIGKVTLKVGRSEGLTYVRLAY